MPETLDQFKDIWCQKPAFRTPFNTPIVIDGNIHGVVLYRNKPYQVQLFIVKPNTLIPPHCHPEVDSFEVYVSGDIEFNVQNHTYLQMTDHEEIEEGLTKKAGMCLRVYPNAWHSAVIGTKGGSFLSIQKWKDGVEPTNVGESWKPLNDPRRNFTYEISNASH